MPDLKKNKNSAWKKKKNSVEIHTVEKEHFWSECFRIENREAGVDPSLIGWGCPWGHLIPNTSNLRKALDVWVMD